MSANQAVVVYSLLIHDLKYNYPTRSVVAFEVVFTSSRCLLGGMCDVGVFSFSPIVEAISRRD